MFKEEIIQLLAKQTKLRENEIENLIEIPPNSELGDYLGQEPEQRQSPKHYMVPHRCT